MTCSCARAFFWENIFRASGSIAFMSRTASRSCPASRPRCTSWQPKRFSGGSQNRAVLRTATKREGTAMDFRLPELGEGIYEAELVAWLVKVGDSVKRGQDLMEVLTDKASMEVPSPFAGSITGLRAGPGQQIKVGD